MYHHHHHHHHEVYFRQNVHRNNKKERKNLRTHTHTRTIQKLLFVISDAVCCMNCGGDDDDKKVKFLPYSLPSVGPVADPGVQAVSPQVTINHPPMW